MVDEHEKMEELAAIHFAVIIDNSEILRAILINDNSCLSVLTMDNQHRKIWKRPAQQHSSFLWFQAWG